MYYMALLTDNLISYWKLDEVSGNALDAFGSNTLTDTNTVGAGTGKINGARDFEETSSQYFRKASNASLQTGDIDFTFTFWVNFESLTLIRRLVSKFGNSAAVNEHAVSYDNVSNRFQFALQENGGAVKSVTANNFGAPSTATWYFVAAWYDHTNDTLNISVNNGTADQTTSVGGPAATAAGFNLGCLFTAVDTAAIQFHDGLLDEVSFWKRLLDASEMTRLYNSGSGLPFDLWGGPSPHHIRRARSMSGGLVTMGV